MKRALLAVLLGVLMAPSPGRPQTGISGDDEGPRPLGGLAFVDELEVTVVNIVAHVTDKKGHPVTDLGREDFRLLQDGVEKPITNFQLYTEEVYRTRFAREQPISGAAPPPTPAAEGDARPAPRPVYMVLYIDNQNLHPLDRNRVLTQARQFVRDNMRPPVQMMVASYQRSLKIVQPFTSDPRLVLDALRSMRKFIGGYPERQSSRREIFDQLQRALQEESARYDNRSRDTREYRHYFNRIVAFAEEEFTDLSFTVDALRAIISTIAGLDGKKGIVYISNGLPMVPGLDLFTAFSNLYQDQAALTQISRFDRTTTFKSLANAANAQDISFYTVGAGGLEVVGIAGAEYSYPIDPLAASLGANNYIDSLRYMADATGGLAIVNTNDFAAGLDRIERDMYTYYSLGYSLNMSGADKVHRIKLTVPDHPGYTVRYRRRFVEKSVESRVQDKVFTGLMIDFDENPLHMAFEAGNQSPASSDRWMVPVHISFPIGSVALLPEGEDYVGRLVLFIAARDSEGKQSDLVRQQHEVRVPSQRYEEAQGEDFSIRTSLLMEEGAYRVSVGLMDQLTRQASFLTLKTRVRGS